MLSQVVIHPALEMALISAVKEPIKRMFRKRLIQIKERLCSSCARLCCSYVIICAYREEEENGLNILCAASRRNTTNTECTDEEA